MEIKARNLSVALLQQKPKPNPKPQEEQHIAKKQKIDDGAKSIPKWVYIIHTR